MENCRDVLPCKDRPVMPDPRARQEPLDASPLWSHICVSGAGCYASRRADASGVLPTPSKRSPSW